MPRARSRRRVTRQEANLVVSLKTYFEREKKEGRVSDLDNVLKRMEEATGIPMDVLEGCCTGTPPPPLPEVVYPPQKTRRKFTNEMEAAVHEFFAAEVEQGRLPTVANFDRYAQSITVNNRALATGSRILLHRAVKAAGYGVAKTRQPTLTERRVVQTQRRAFLRDMQTLRGEGREVFYLGETCVRADMVEWLPDAPALEEDALKSKQLPHTLLCGVGSARTGWLEGINSLFLSLAKHRLSSGCVFPWPALSDWLEKQIIPFLPNSAVLVVDTSPNHLVVADVMLVPPSHGKKQDYLQWLQDNDIPITNPDGSPANLLLATEKVPVGLSLQHLRDLCHRHRPKPAYRIKRLFEAAGRDLRVLFVPHQYPEMNAVQAVWGRVKEGIAAQSTQPAKASDSNTLNSVIQQEYCKVTREAWSQAEADAIAWEERWRALDELMASRLSDSTDEDSDMDPDPSV